MSTDAVIEEAMSETADIIGDYNAEQMFRGIEATGGPITPAYTFATVAIKKQKGQPSDRVTLKDTGAFYQGIYAQVSVDRLEIGSNDGKTTALMNKYGAEIFGLSDTFKREYLRENLGPVLRQKITSLTGLKFR
jgi:hypothetical protein